VTPADAQALWIRHSGRRADRVTRLATGSANFVFLVEQADSRCILRAAAPENREVLRGSVYWLDRLAPLQLPVPRLLASRLDDDVPHVVLSYLEGQDLGAVYGSLSAEQKQLIAADLWAMQRRVGTLTADGFGYLASLDDPNKKRGWKEVVSAHLARSRSWIRECGLFDEGWVDRLEERLPEFDADFAAVEPRAFFDDATTKNVLVHEGRFSGLVDLDWLCFGDRLYTVALTRMSLLESGGDQDYIEFLSTEEGLDGRLRVLSFYTLAFCVDFMGGLGMQFNKPEKPFVTEEQKARLIGLYELLERELAASEG
jgi:Ser/Thr protein kinase RdoA (MazF antagonist)